VASAAREQPSQRRGAIGDRRAPRGQPFRR
jgi:hypothetical protein